MATPDPANASIACLGCGVRAGLSSECGLVESEISVFIEGHRTHEPLGFELVLGRREPVAAGPRLASIPMQR